MLGMEPVLATFKEGNTLNTMLLLQPPCQASFEAATNCAWSPFVLRWKRWTQARVTAGKQSQVQTLAQKTLLGGESETKYFLFEKT